MTMDARAPYYTCGTVVRTFSSRRASSRHTQQEKVGIYRRNNPGKHASSYYTNRIIYARESMRNIQCATSNLVTA